MEIYYRRNLPHYQPDGGEFFCTFRLIGSLPKDVIDRYKHQNNLLEQAFKQKSISKTELNSRKFSNFDNLLDKYSSNNFWLKQPNIAQIVAKKLHDLDSQKYQLISFCIMPNHVHLLVKLFEQNTSEENSTRYPLTSILKQIKGSTAVQCNKILKRSGQFWQHESYDHLVRDCSERQKIIRYILQNPVQAGLVPNWKKWPWTFCKEKFLPV